jgi:hypothetical protein
MLEWIQGNETAGTTEFIYYKNGTTYTLLGSANNAPHATSIQVGAPDWSYAALVYLPPGDDPANIIVYDQAGTIQTL